MAPQPRPQMSVCQHRVSAHSRRPSTVASANRREGAVEKSLLQMQQMSDIALGEVPERPPPQAQPVDSSILPPSQRYSLEIQSRLESMQAPPQPPPASTPTAASASQPISRDDSAVFFSAQDLSTHPDTSTYAAPTPPNSTTSEHAFSQDHTAPVSGSTTGSGNDSSDSSSTTGSGNDSSGSSSSSSATAVAPPEAAAGSLEMLALQALDRIEESALRLGSATASMNQPLDLLQPLISRLEMLAASITMLEGKNVKLMGEVASLSYSRDNGEAGREVLLSERAGLMKQLQLANLAAMAASSTAASQEVALTTLRQAAREAAAAAAGALALSNQRFEALELAAAAAAAALGQARAEAAQGAAAIAALERRLKKEASLSAKATDVSKQKLDAATAAANQSALVASANLSDLVTQLSSSQAALASLTLTASERKSLLADLQMQAAAASEQQLKLDGDLRSLSLQNTQLTADNATLAQRQSLEKLESAVQLQRSQEELLQSQQKLQQQALQLQQQTDASSASQSRLQLDLESALAAAKDLEVQRSGAQLEFAKALSQAEAAAAGAQRDVVGLEAVAVQTAQQVTQLQERNLVLQAESAVAASALDSVSAEVQRLRTEAQAHEAEMRAMAVGAREGRAAAQESRVLASNILNMAAQGVTASRERQEMSLELEGARASVAANASVAAGLEEQITSLRKQVQAANEQASSSSALAARQLTQLSATHTQELAAARSEAAAAERLMLAAQAALTRETAEGDRLQGLLLSRSVTAAAFRQGSTVPRGVAAFTNTNRYYVPSHVLLDFMKAIAVREAALLSADGFVGLVVTEDEEALVFAVSTLWQTIPDFEAWSTSMPARRSHFPRGVLQYVPAKGEGFPEDFVPFRDLSAPVSAKY
ncbi:MAG: hypothetical protein WDW38_009314 [Sanguina aurantia]